MTTETRVRPRWFAVPLEMCASPQAHALRAEMGAPDGDVYLWRAWDWCAHYAPRTGELIWDACAEWIRFPGSGEDMRRVFTRAGLVGPNGRLVWYERVNGWLAIRREKEVARVQGWRRKKKAKKKTVNKRKGK